MKTRAVLAALLMSAISIACSQVTPNQNTGEVVKKVSDSCKLDCPDSTFELLSAPPERETVVANAEALWQSQPECSYQKSGYRFNRRAALLERCSFSNSSGQLLAGIQSEAITYTFVDERLAAITLAGEDGSAIDTVLEHFKSNGCSITNAENQTAADSNATAYLASPAAESGPDQCSLIILQMKDDGAIKVADRAQFESVLGI